MATPAPTSSTTPSPTPKEALLFLSIVMNQEGGQVNWAAVAKEAGYRSADVCRTRFGQLKHKYNAGRTGTASGGSPAKTIPADETVVKNGSPSKSKKRANPGGISEGQRRTKVKKEEKLKGEEGGGGFY